jgi:hypothetical protein
VIEALGAFGPVAESAVPALIQALREELIARSVGPDLEAEQAARALGRIAPGTKSADEALAALIETFDPVLEVSGPNSRASPARLAAIEALPAFGPAAIRALPRLRLLSKSPDRRVRMAAENAVSAIGHDRTEGSPPSGTSPVPAPG